MTTGKKIVDCAWKLYDGGPAHTERWFLFTKQAGRRVKDYAGLGKIKDLAARRAAAQRLLAERNGLAAPAIEEGELSELAKEWIRIRHSDRANTNNNRKSAARTFEREMRAAGHSYHTVDEAFAWAYARKYNTHYVTTARTLLKLSIKQQLRKSPSPFLDVRLVEDHEPATLVPPSLQPELLAKIEERAKRVWVMCKIQYYAFIRPSEQVRLEISDINLLARTITIPGKKSKNRRGLTVVIPDPLMPILMDWLAEAAPGQRFVFEHNGKGYKGHGSFRIMHQQVVAKMPVLPQGVKLYSWKHCGAVAACNANVPLRQLQMQLRHKSLDQVVAYLRQMGVEDMGAVAKGW